MDFSRKGVVISRTNLVENKKSVSIPWKGLVFILVVVAGLWAGGNYYLSYSKEELVKVKNELAALRTGRDYEKMALIADGASRLVSIDTVLKDRFDWNTLFLQLEKNTTREVTFNSMSAVYSDETATDLLTAGSAMKSKKCTVSLNGDTMGILNVSKQVAAFKDEKNPEQSFANKVKLDRVDLKETSSSDGSVGAGNVSFSLNLEINPKIFVSEEDLSDAN